MRRAARRRPWYRRFIRTGKGGRTTTLPPVFVGGTGRSGTTIAAKLLGAHPDYEMIPIEVKFISVRGGLRDLAAGRTTVEAFEEQLMETWFDRGPQKGLHLLMDRGAIEAELPALRQGLRADPWRAAADFAHRLLDPVAEVAGAQGWVEMTPQNAAAARQLNRMFPDMRLVHVVRDGRDVACSVVRFDWGANDAEQGLDWWAVHLERGFAAGDALPPERVLVVQMEDLVIRDREHEYARLLSFMGLDDNDATRDFFERQVSPEAAHAGRWREEVPPERRAAFEAHYERLVDDLRQRRRPYHPESRARAEATST